jgi:hypothetical protein
VLTSDKNSAPIHPLHDTATISINLNGTPKRILAHVVTGSTHRETDQIIICTYLLQMVLAAVRKKFCVFCSHFLGELFGMQHQQQQSKKKKKETKKEWEKGCE